MSEFLLFFLWLINPTSFKYSRFSQVISFSLLQLYTFLVHCLCFVLLWWFIQPCILPSSLPSQRMFLHSYCINSKYYVINFYSFIFVSCILWFLAPQILVIILQVSLSHNVRNKAIWNFSSRLTLFSPSTFTLQFQLFNQIT